MIHQEEINVVSWSYLENDESSDSYRFEISNVPVGSLTEIDINYTRGRLIVFEFEGLEVSIDDSENEFCLN